MSDCIFCKIANGEIPSATLYEDDNFRVILDMGPSRRGHSLILPKNHYENLFELPDDLKGEALKVASKVGTAMMKALPCEGVQIMQNNGLAAGQTVFHFHMHLIPGYESEGPGATWVPGTLADDDKVNIPEAIKAAL